MVRSLIFSACVSLAVVSSGFAATNNSLHQYRIGEYQKASKGLQQLANQKHKVGSFYLGMMYLKGYGQAKNTEKAMQLISQSAAAGYLQAQMFMGKYYLQEKNNPQKAILWFKKAAEQKDVDAQMYASAAYQFGYGVKKNPSLARRYYIKAAKSGNMIAQYTLAIHFINSRHRKNKRLGVIWLRKSAEKDYQPAQEKLGRIYNAGKMVKKNRSQAVYWLNKAGVNMLQEQAPKPQLVSNLTASTEQTAPVKELSAQAKAMLWITNNKYDTTHVASYQLPANLFAHTDSMASEEGAHNMTPKLVTIKRSEIFKELTTLTNPEDLKLSAFINIVAARNYSQKKLDLFIPRYVLVQDASPQFLFEQLSRQATHGYAKSQFMLGMMYESGVGTQKDLEKAIHWYKKSAAQNYLRAEYNLGLLYLEGNGVERNYKTALHWLNKAAFKGSTYAQYLLALTHEYGLGQAGDRNYIPKDIGIASGMYHLASSNGYPKAQYNLAELYSSGMLGRKNSIKDQKEWFDLTLTLYKRAAEQGIEPAKLALAYYYIDTGDKTKQQWAFDVARAEMKNNNPRAELALALMYDRGVGVTQNKEKAIKLYKQLALKNNPIAEFILGTYYYLGESVDKNTEMATELLTRAARKNLAFADYNLALMKYLQNPHSDFLYLMRQAAAKHYSQANLFLANYYLTQSASRNDLGDAANIYLKLADNGYASAQLKLGYMYQQGIYFNRNYSTAEKWYEKAAYQNNRMAQYLLGNMYHVGLVNQPNLDKATFWYEKSEKLGFVPAKVALGFIYEHVYHDYPKAYALYQEAARKGTPQAQYNFALMNELGKGTEVDIKAAAKWYEKSAAQGFSPAQYALANVYLQAGAREQARSTHVFLPRLRAAMNYRTDDKKVIELLTQSAKQNSPYAMYQLGLLYEAGVGVPINLQTAQGFYTMAADHGDAQAKLALIRLKSYGTEDETSLKNAYQYYLQAARKGDVLAKSLVAKMYQSGTGVTKNESKANVWLEQLSQNKVAKNADKTDKLLTLKGFPNYLYMKVINNLNQGQVAESMTTLKQMTKSFPKYQPAQRAYQQIVKLEKHASVVNP